MSLNYEVFLKQSEEGFTVACPGLPGCWSQGATEEEAIQNIQVAIQDYLEGRRELLNGENFRSVTVTV